MTEVIVDPYVFVVPAIHSPERARTFLNWLSEWGMAFRRMRECCVTSEGAIRAMVTDGTYPTLDSIRALIRTHGIDGVSAPDIVNTIRGLTDFRPYIEDRCGVRQVVVANAPAVNPAAYLDRLSPAVASAYVESLLCAIVSQDARWSLSNTVIGTRPDVTGSEPIVSESETPNMVVAGVVEICERSDSTLQDGPIDAEHAFPVVFRAPADGHSKEITAVYGDVEVATRIAFETMVQPCFVGSKMGRVLADDGFVKSIQTQGLHNQPSILRRIFLLAAWASAGVIKDVPGAGLHPVRTSAAAEAEQVEGPDGEKLWRCIVTKRGAGFRLQYWALRDGSVRLQGVMVESVVL